MKLQNVGMSTKGERIKQLRDLMDLTQQAFADRLPKVTRGAVGNWERDQGIKLENLTAIADEFNCSVDWLANNKGKLSIAKAPEAQIELEPIKVRGKVLAGEFQPTWEYPEEDRYSVLSPRSKRYTDVDKFGLKVVGPSMNLVYPEGTILICAKLYDLLEEAPIDKKRYIVVCTDAFGDKEATVKELEVLEDGTKWLWPRSSSPMHQSPIPLPSPPEAECSCELFARVLRAILPEE